MSTETTPDGAARAEAKRLYPEWTHDDRQKAGYHAYLKGRADQRARIAARRDEVAEALDKVIDLPDSEEDWSQEMCDVYDTALDFGTGRMLARKVLVRDVTAAVLAALGVSEP